MTRLIRAAAFGGFLLAAAGVGPAQETPAGERVTGRWFVRDQRLCLEWEPRGRECWPYQAALVRGQATRVTSDRGLTVTVTLI